MKACWNFALAAGLLLSGATYAQERVVAAEDKEALFRSSDPKLHANKQLAYRLVKEIPESTDPATIDKYLTERYIQHNPNMVSGRDGLKKLIGSMKPKPVADKLAARVVAVVAGDCVVSTVRTARSKNPGKTYTTHFTYGAERRQSRRRGRAPLGLMAPAVCEVRLCFVLVADPTPCIRFSVPSKARRNAPAWVPNFSIAE
jgi:predicted SnoaL-like aldol condensation-catalyzing enzyme